jgi:hypothetical protein
MLWSVLIPHRSPSAMEAFLQPIVFRLIKWLTCVTSMRALQADLIIWTSSPLNKRRFSKNRVPVRIQLQEMVSAFSSEQLVIDLKQSVRPALLLSPASQHIVSLFGSSSISKGRES